MTFIEKRPYSRKKVTTNTEQDLNEVLAEAQCAFDLETNVTAKRANKIFLDYVKHLLQLQKEFKESLTTLQGGVL